MTLRPVPSPSDWGTDDGYDPHQRLTKSTDGRGNATEIRVRVPPEVAGEIASLVQRGKIPEYRTNADVVRDAIYHRLRFIRENDEIDKEVERRGRMAMTAAQVASLDGEIEERGELVSNTSKHLARVAKDGNQQDLHQAITAAEKVADDLPDPWKAQMEAAIREAKRGLV